MKTQIQIKKRQKVYEDFYDPTKHITELSRIGSELDSVFELAKRFKSLYVEAHRFLFNFVVQQIWLEQHFSYNGTRRKKRRGNGHAVDWAFAYFMKAIVGYSQKPMTTTFPFTAISTYLKDFFPDFLNHDPDKESEYFKFPYKHITLDYLLFVYMVHNRLELLEEAEERKMSFIDFANWATNEVFCYNDDMGKEIYVMMGNRFFWPHLKNTTYKRGWADNKFLFDFPPSRKTK